ncbi:uncharacterized protein LOC116843408 [Odontomachus brunneus]|uniref:uncharacterized protein LOC116843408 n=1 Tax=Odontomachus brunneus TaxID=486640 RepID=UPI0013F196A6|nr:uncharacterized protein LOC116843408 [Odontomachus brunneus]
MTRPIWKYTSPGELATSGIYSQADLEEFKDHILFPAERPSVLNTLARGMMGQATTIHGGSFMNLLDEAALEKLATSTWDRIWGKFLIFGNISAGLLGIVIIIRMIKLILDTILHGVALHSVFGCSLYLIGALWDSLTQLLLHFGGKSKTGDNHPMGTQEVKSLKNLSNDPSPIITAPSCPPNVIEYQQLRSTFPQEDSNSYSLSLTA